MASLHTPVHVSTTPLIPSPYPPLSSIFSIKQNTITLHRVKSALANPNWLNSRRLVSLSLFLSTLSLAPNHAIAGSFLDKYVKKKGKKLDPIEVYVPAVILTQLQIKDLEKTLEVDEPQFASCRSLLRSGPAASLRGNIPAVAQYASDSGTGNTAFNDVDQCLRAVEELDSLLLHASRKEPDASVKSMKVKIGVAVDALESLLHTVPPDVLEKGKAIADAYRSSEEEEEPHVLDPELKELESIL